MRMTALFTLLMLALAAPATAKGDPAPLFASDAPIQVTIAGPIRSIIANAERSTTAQPATLTANGETLKIMLSARGLTRRHKEICPFPPFLVAFPDKPAATSLFAKQGRIKLVTHCNNNTNFDQYALREYTVYRLYNVLTPESLRVRLARMRYEDGGKLVTERWGFFIEDIDAAAKRMDGKEIDVESVPSSSLDHADAARYALFQYMISNLDWDMGHGPKGTECCHNSKLVGATADARADLIPVPYDFDYSGMVNAPYAATPEVLANSTVRRRFYWGLCRHNDEVKRAVPVFIAARPALEAEISKVEQLSDKDKADMLKYLAGFFDDIATPDKVDRVLKTCR